MRIVRTRDRKLNLCDYCINSNGMPLCLPAENSNVDFGDGFGNDNIIACSNYCFPNGQREVPDSIYVEE